MSKPLWIKLRDYRERYFEGHPPSINTLKKLINSGELAGRKMGRVYFVDIATESVMTGDPLVDAVLKER
jgi:hypothetical protein